MASLVTGASGFLGGRLAQMLGDQGEEIVLLARPTSRLEHLAGTPVRVVTGDLSNEDSLREAVRDVTRIFHCAACSTDWAKQETYVAANVRGTENLIRAAAKASRLERFVHVSTTDVYGYPEVPCTEDHGFVDAGLPYNQTKGRGEELVWRAGEAGLPITIVRPATIYGPRGKDFTQEIATMLRQRLMLYVDGGRSTGGFTYVDNVARAMLTASVSSVARGQAYNIADGTGATWKKYLTMFAGQLGTRPPWIDLSFKTAMGLAGVMESPHRMLGLSGRPLLTRHAVYLLGRDQEFPIVKAERDFGYKAEVTLEEGIARSVDWLRDSSARKR